PGDRAARTAPVLPAAGDVVISPHTLSPSDVARGTDTTTGGATAPDEEEGFGPGAQGVQPKAQPEPQRQGLLGALLGDGGSPESSEAAPQRGTPEAESSPPPPSESGAEGSGTAEPSAGRTG
nr:hypothetical protein [Solirubrobacterales bacterium]